MSENFQYEQKPNWVGVVLQFEKLVDENNLQIFKDNPNVAAISSVLFLGVIILCGAITLNNQE